jgi:putative tricarboxylic transport membrane protein
MFSEILMQVIALDNLMIILGCTLYGTFVGAIPGLTATMAVALLVPFTFYLDPVPAISAIVATTTTAIFAGDISGTLLRIPGTPASAAYIDDAYRLSKVGRAKTSLLVSVTTAAIGGVVGVIILSLLAPQLARIAISFSSFESFWLACLGLTCAVLTGHGTVPKSLASLFIGLAIASVGIDIAVGHPRFTFGLPELLDGISFIPAMIGIFAFSEVLRSVQSTLSGQAAAASAKEKLGQAAARAGRALGTYRTTIARSSIMGTLIGALPGAGADIAAWISYAVARRFSKEPEKFGNGHLEGIAAGGSANNAAIAGAWTPSLVFGIPGDSVTAIAIGVLMLKGLSPGPRIFIDQPELIHTLFGSFFLANIIMLPMGLLAIMMSSYILRIPRAIMTPIILLFSLVGAYAINGSAVAIWIVLGLGITGYFMEQNGIPLAPAILGIVLGKIIEDNFMVSMIKAQGNVSAFFEREYSMILGVATVLLWCYLIVRTGVELMSKRHRNL